MRLEFTVSTRQAVPRGAFSTRPSIAGPSRTSSTHRPGVLADRPRDGLVLPVRRTAVTIRRRAASKRASSIDVRRGPRGYASPRLHRSTTARRRRGTWIRRPPHRRDGQHCTSGSSYGGKIGSRICDVSEKAGECFLNPTIDPRKGSTASRASFSPPGEKVGGGAVPMRGLVEANWRWRTIWSRPTPHPSRSASHPSADRMRSASVPKGRRKPVTLCYLFADL